MSQISTDLEIYKNVNTLLRSGATSDVFRARQLMLARAPASMFVESYLQDNEGRKQNLDAFPMMRQIYDHVPRRLLLKCSRKTLKSTLLSNLVCLNMVRYNRYNMMYVAPQEASTKYFSSNYVSPRFDSPQLKKLFVKGWEKNDVYEKKFADTGSTVLFKYAKDDATRIRGPATDHNLHDEVQDMQFAILPIIKETMALSRYKREIFAGTPLTTDNTINVLWNLSINIEWFTKCQGCNHWNALIEDNNPMKMVQKKGLCCSRCDKVLDTSLGHWVCTNPDINLEEADAEEEALADGVVLPPTRTYGYHLAQPILPHFNQSASEWNEIYDKVHNDGKTGVHQIFNEVFGLAYDIGSKPITEAELRKLCVLGPIRGPNDELAILAKKKIQYAHYTTGVDWGVNMTSSRTVAVHGALRTDGYYEVFLPKVYETFDYNEHIRDIADTLNYTQAFALCDGGPDPIRAHSLMDLTDINRTLIIRYGNGKLIHHYDVPAGAESLKQARLVLHRSDCLSFTFRLLKAGKILFPEYDQTMKKCIEDILAENIEVKTTGMTQELVYTHNPLKSDDFLHALCWAVVGAYIRAGDDILSGESSTAFNPEDDS